MDRLKRSYVPESTFQVSARTPEATFQTSNRTYLATEKHTTMECQVEYTDKFEQWWKSLDESTQDSIAFVVTLLEQKGVDLPYRYSSKLKGSRYGNLRELRVSHNGEPYRVLYAFDPRRVAVLLLGGNKVGNNRWYQENISKAEKLYDELLEELREEGLI